jgi:hypothetical protein
MSALPLIADIDQRRWDVRKVPQADLAISSPGLYSQRAVSANAVKDVSPGDAHSSLTVSWAPSSATKTASRLAGSVALAFSLTRCSLPGGSKKVSPAL